MTPLAFLVIVGAMQGALLGALLLLLLVNRARTRRGQALAGVGAARIQRAMQDWVLDAAPLEPLLAALREAPSETAVEQVALALATRVTAERRPALVYALREEFWVRDILSYGMAFRWTSRLRTARLLGALGIPEDEVRVKRLMADPHPAVRAAVTAAIGRVGTPSMIRHVLELKPSQPSVVRQLQRHILLQSATAVVPVLRERLLSETRPTHLTSLIDLAVGTRDPALLPLAAGYASHPDREVRAAAGRALAQWFHPDAPVKLQQLLSDPEPAVRAIAARGLGMLAVSDAAPALARALQDSQWWVRFRSALALALLGDPGRAVLREVAESSDRYAADMARMISGLPPGALRELAEA